MDESSPKKTFSELKEDPEYLYSFIDKHVELQLIKNVSFCGFVHAIDSVTHSIILAVPKEDQHQTVLIPGHAVKKISENPTDKNPPPRRPTIQGSDEETSAQKTKLLAWFKQNMLPVTQQGENLVVGSVSVLPPYRSSNIYAQNTVVGLQIRKIMDSMPEDFAVK